MLTSLLRQETWTDEELDVLSAEIQRVRLLNPLVRRVNRRIDICIVRF
jgi:hypothetical protein